MTGAGTANAWGGAGAGIERRALSLRMPVVASLALHAALVTAFVVLRPSAPPASPPVYRVNILAAPPGERAIGVVQPTSTPTPPPSAPAATPVRPKTEPRAIPVPTTRKAAPPVARAATPTLPTPAVPTATAPPAIAGGGPTGGRGTDVATVQTPGIDFPYPGYLENIVRQVALRFRPSARGALRAEVAFLIRRDGSVQQESIRLVARSGVYSFDLEAQGAVEAAATARAFGALPAGYPDDVLPVTFRFDPRFLR